MPRKSSSSSVSVFSDIATVSVCEHSPYPGGCGFVYDERCLHHKAGNSDHPERPLRASNIVKEFEIAKLKPRLQPIASRPITTSELLLTHNHDLIDAVRRTPERLDGQLFKYFEGPEFGDTYFNAETSFLAELAAGGVTELLDHMADNRVHNGIAVIRPPGHHAECHKAMGFCVYNNVAVAINAMRAKHPEEFKKVLIVDWDVHHGNGTQNIFYSDPNVLFFSIHRSDNGAYYPSTGFHDECGDQEGKGFNINVPLPGPGLGDWEYVETWDRLLIPVARAFAPDLIVISAGFDAALGDPLGGMEVTPAGYAYMMSSLLPLTNVPGRIAVALEGGYNVSAIADSFVHVVHSLLGDTVSMPELDVPEISRYTRRDKRNHLAFKKELYRCLKIQSAFWPCLAEKLNDDRIALLGSYASTPVSTTEHKPAAAAEPVPVTASVPASEPDVEVSVKSEVHTDTQTVSSDAAVSNETAPAAEAPVTSSEADLEAAIAKIDLNSA